MLLCSSSEQPAGGQDGQRLPRAAHDRAGRITKIGSKDVNQLKWCNVQKSLQYFMQNY